MSSELSEARLAYYRQYARTHFFDCFRRGQGTEQVLNTLQRHALAGRWLDLGAGPMTLFWAQAVTQPVTITSSDAWPEALEALRECLAWQTPPPCYAEALHYLGLPVERFYLAQRSILSTQIIDFMKPWRAASAFDMMTELGAFGLASTGAQFAACVRRALSNLRAGGRFIGANWHRTSSYAESLGSPPNDYLHPSLIAGVARSARAPLLHCEVAPVIDDPHYDSVLIWVLEKGV